MDTQVFYAEEELLVNSFNSTTFTYNKKRNSYKFYNYPLLLEQDIVIISSFPNLKFWSFLQRINLIKQDTVCPNCCDRTLTKLYFQNKGSPVLDATNELTK